MTREFRDAACEGKQALATPEMARAAAARRPGRKAYRCQWCGFWHVGHPNGTGRRPGGPRGPDEDPFEEIPADLLTHARGVR